jgi:predicted SAM-dependent methyltransferase
LERHRSLRQLYLQLRSAFSFEQMSALQISRDSSIQPQWFTSLEVSVYGEENSIDIQNIDRPDQSYDIVICNHVLEHVERDKQALKELMRITSERGFLQLSVPDPFRRQTTVDWGYPDEKQHGHYRVYGMDIENMFYQICPQNVYYQKLYIADPVTEMSDVYFFFIRSQKNKTKIQNILEGTPCNQNDK